MQHILAQGRVARAKREESAVVVQRSIPDLSSMLSLAVSLAGQRMVPWLLHLDARASMNGGYVVFARKVLLIVFVMMGLPYVVLLEHVRTFICDECGRLRDTMQAAPDTDRSRGIYLGQDAAGVGQWMLPGDIDLNKCPECRAEQGGLVFVSQAHHIIQFNALREEFKEHELARRLSSMLKRTNVLQRFLLEGV